VNAVRPPERLAEAVEFALAAGLLKYAAPGRPQHAPFVLAPCPIPPALNQELEALTAPFNALAWAVSRDIGFLAETLAPAADVDEYTAFVAGLARTPRSQQPLELLITRSDYFVAANPAGGAPHPRQVELNTIAASYPGLAGLIHRLHRQVWFDQPWAGRLAPNDPLAAIEDGIAEALRRYGHPGAIAAMIVRPDETNVFDQRLLEARLRERGIEMRRLSLREIGEQGALREGHLTIQGRIVALAYYRAGYAPDDLRHPSARAGMERIAQSSAIAVPSPAVHLSGSKKVQQVLANPAALARFASAPAAARLKAAFVALHGPEDPISGQTGTHPAWQEALRQPSRWVLKPQREGGGNNHFDQQLVDALNGSTARDRQAYILMERIRPVTHQAWLVRDGQAEEAECVSEIGRYGVLLAEGDRCIFNRDAGYLVRTRPSHVRESGISAGFGCLDSLLNYEAPA
jgi:glutathione synthase